MTNTAALTTNRAMEDFVSEAWRTADGISIFLDDMNLAGSLGPVGDETNIRGRVENVEAFIAAIPSLHSRGEEFMVFRSLETNAPLIILFPED